MELHFEPIQMKYLREILQETKCQEETIETIVPDSYPDVQRILCGSAVAVVRNKEYGGGSISLNGGINARALYMAEGEMLPRCLEVYLPFHVKTETSLIPENSQSTANVYVRNVDVRMLNSRKIVVRVNLCWTLTVYEPCEQLRHMLQEQPDCLQTHTVDYVMTLPVETAQRNFQMSEELQLPSGRPLVGEIYQFVPTLNVTEKRLAGNKAVFKGLLHLRVLYGSQGDAMATYETELPFSQYCELTDVYEDEEMDLALCLAGYELDRTMQQEGEKLQLSLQILAQCVVKENKTVQMVEDAYCLDCDFVPEWEEFSVINRLDRQVVSKTVRESRQANVTDIVDAWAVPGHGQIARKNDGVQITVPVTVNVLYRDDDGMLQLMNFQSDVTEDIALNENARCCVKAEICGDIIAVPSGQSIELRFPLTMTLESYAEGNFRSLCGAELQEKKEKRKNMPAVIARRTRSGESLWNIAKTSGTTVEKLRRANHLEQDVTEAGVLLIPTWH